MQEDGDITEITKKIMIHKTQTIKLYFEEQQLVTRG
jgi:hypothetical protein